MGLYEFKPRFVPLIERGEKTHTIRPFREHADEAGDTLHLYTGLRRKGARLLMRVPCVKVEMIEIVEMPGKRFPDEVDVYLNMQRLDRSEKDALAKRDGFADLVDMMNFWTGRLPFTGQIVHWDFAKRRM